VLGLAKDTSTHGQRRGERGADFLLVYVGDWRFNNGFGRLEIKNTQPTSVRKGLAILVSLDSISMQSKTTRSDAAWPFVMALYISFAAGCLTFGSNLLLFNDKIYPLETSRMKRTKKTRRKCVLFFVIAMAIFRATAIAAPIPSPEIKQVVAFVFVQADKVGRWDNKANWRPHGTAFFVSVGDPKIPGRIFVYLVTAKHVLQYQPEPQNRALKKWFPTIQLRINTAAGESDFVSASIVPEGETKTVFLHEEDTNVDIAVIPVGSLDEKRFEFKVLPDDMITTKTGFRDLQITEGSEIFFTGLFTPHIGTRRNYPVVRFGKVALITDEKIKFADDLEANLYLVDTGSYAGNSGSPVYFYLGADRRAGAINLGPPIIKLAGVMSGTFQDVQPLRLIENAQIAVPASVSNMGIAAVVPAYKLHEILFGKELTRKREQ